MSIKGPVGFYSVVVDRYFASRSPRNLKVLPRQKYPVQTTASAPLIPAGNLVKPLSATARTKSEPHPVAIPVPILPVLPIYDYARGHGGMPRNERSY